MKVTPTIKRKGQRGFTIIELMIAMVILAIGLGGLLVLFATAMNTNAKNTRDTGGTMAAQEILEQITAQPAAQGSAPITVTDCAGNQFLVATDGGAPVANPANVAGNGAPVVPASGQGVGFPGDIDWSQGPPTQATNAAAGYYIPKFATCGAGAARVQYELRWNVKQLTAYSRQIVVASREVGSGSANMGRLRFAMPVSLRSFGGQ